MSNFPGLRGIHERVGGDQKKKRKTRKARPTEK